MCGLHDNCKRGTVIKNKWHILRKIGCGAFGEVYEAVNIRTRQLVAIKMEPQTLPKPSLKMEVAVLKQINGQRHITHFYGCGRIEGYNFIVISLEGKNLADLKRYSWDQKFSFSTGLRIICQIIECIRLVHSIGFLHRDIKPSNFCIGSKQDRCRDVYILDFGLSRIYRDINGDVRPARSIVGFRGTVRYASVNAHKNLELARVDDLWSMFYILSEFIRGQLPWDGARTRDLTGKMKLTIDNRKLIQNIPGNFFSFLNHLQSIGYYDVPDYDYLLSIIENSLQQQGITKDDPFDWETLPHHEKITTKPNVRRYQALSNNNNVMPNGLCISPIYTQPLKGPSSCQGNLALRLQYDEGIYNTLRTTNTTSSLFMTS